MIIRLSDYMKETTDAAAAIRSALEKMSEGDTLELCKERLDIFPEKAEVRSYFISNNDPGEKPIAFPIVGKKGITIDGGGAELVFHGRILPFVIDSSSDITVKNISIDYSSVWYSQAEIIEADRHKTVLKFSKDTPCRVEDGKFCFEVYGGEDILDEVFAVEFELDEKGSPRPSSCKPPYFPYSGEKKDHGFLSGMYRDVMLEGRGRNEVIMHGNLGFVHTVGNNIVMLHSSREFPGIFINESKDVRLEGINIYYTSGMGVIGQLSENITLDRVKAEPRKGSGRMISVNADATHFVNCRGKITMTGCKFVSMNDDACNIHGIYLICDSNETPETIICTFGHYQQRGINICRVGDRVAIIDKKTSSTVCTRLVVASELISPEKLRLTLDRAVELGEDYLVENLSTAPEIYISDCESGNNRPRGFLLSSAGKTVIERCKFYNMHCGIQIGGEMRDWYESGAVTDVTISDCDFENSAYAGGTAISIAPKLYERVPRDLFHGRILIQYNRFTQSSKRFLHAELVRELIVRENRFRLDKSLPLHNAAGENGMYITNCGKVSVEEIRELL